MYMDESNTVSAGVDYSYRVVGSLFSVLCFCLAQIRLDKFLWIMEILSEYFVHKLTEPKQKAV